MNVDEAIARVLSRTGGSRQRIDAAPRIQPSQSVLFDRLTGAWGWGLVSAPVLQWLAEGATLDGADTPE
eukprot:6431508-Lingulodinium_polyedra.AAC.1